MAKRIEDDAPTFEGNSETLIRSRRLHDLCKSDKWEFGNLREKGRGHDSKRKDHRRNNKE